MLTDTAAGGLGGMPDAMDRPHSGSLALPASLPAPGLTQHTSAPTHLAGASAAQRVSQRDGASVGVDLSRVDA